MIKAVYLSVVAFLSLVSPLIALSQVWDGCPGPYPRNYQGRISSFAAVVGQSSTYSSFQTMADYWLLGYQIELIDEAILSPYISANPIGNGEVYSHTFNVATTGCVRLWKIDWWGTRLLYGLVRPKVDITFLPTTAAHLGSFSAQWSVPGHVEVKWDTLVEFYTLGFFVERSTANGKWSRVSQMIPATGYDYRPQQYTWLDQKVKLSSATQYRLIEIDLRGIEHVLAVSEVKKRDSHDFPYFSAPVEHLW